MKKVCRYGCLASRILLGLVFFVFGLNGLKPFLPMPAMEPHAMQFILAMADTGYLLFLVKIIEVACGALLLSGLYVPLALTLLGPGVVNIVLFHFFLAPPPWMAIVIGGMWLFLMYCYRNYFRTVFVQKAKPADC